MSNEHKIILDLCGGTGSWSRPYKEAGYDVRVIMLPEFDITRTHFIREAVCFESGTGNRMILDMRCIHGILAAPPCTMFSLARTTAKTPRDFIKGMETVEACLRIIWECQKRGRLKFWALENPKAMLRWFLGKPPLTFDPCDYGDPHTKQTDLWGFYNEPKKNPIKLTPEQKKRMSMNSRELPKLPDGYTAPDGKQSARRAMTPQGFAKAFFLANK